MIFIKKININMGKQIKISEEELHSLIKNKILEAVENIEKMGKDLGYAPAIGNKKRGPGKNVEDQMKKRRNTKLDEDIDERDIYRRLPDGDYDYDGDDGSDTEDGATTITLDAADYRLALEDIYGRDFENVDELWEEYNWPEDISIKYTVHTTCDRGDYDTPSYCDEELADWEIDEDGRYLSSLSPETFKLVEKAVEHHMEKIDVRDLNESKKKNKYDMKTIRLTESQLHRMIAECVKKALNNSTLNEGLFNKIFGPSKADIAEKENYIKNLENALKIDNTGVYTTWINSLLTSLKSEKKVTPDIKNGVKRLFNERPLINKGLRWKMQPTTQTNQPLSQQPEQPEQKEDFRETSEYKKAVYAAYMSGKSGQMGNGFEDEAHELESYFYNKFGQDSKEYKSLRYDMKSAFNKGNSEWKISNGYNY